MIQLKMELFHHTTLEKLLIYASIETLDIIAFGIRLKVLALWNRTHQRQRSVLDEQFIWQAKILGT
jgi:hypothetical protein